MSVPNFQELLLPLLKLAADENEHPVAEAVYLLGVHLNLSEEDKKELLPSGRQTRFANRVAWARAHLKAAGLLENPARGTFRITDVGLELLDKTPAGLSMKDLEQFPSYLVFRAGKLGVPSQAERAASPLEQTPEEALETAYSGLRQQLADELLDRVRAAPPSFFEQLVVDLLVAMGYGGSRQDAGQAVGQSGDGGIDGIIKEDRLGLDVVYVQAKRWEGNVGRPVVQAFAGSLEGQRARKGVLITTSAFSAEAVDYVSKIEKKIVLVDGRALAELMIEHGVGVHLVQRYELKRVDDDYFAGVATTEVAP